jgi:hypothetical protein
MRVGATAGSITTAGVNGAWAILAAEAGANAPLAAIAVENQAGSTPSSITAAWAIVEAAIA